MKKIGKVIAILLLLIGIVLFIRTYIYPADIAVLNPKGMIAHKEKSLLQISSLLMLIVVVPVLILTPIFAFRYHAKKGKGKYEPEWGHSNFAEALWWGVPFVIITILAVITWKSTHELNPFTPIRNEKEPLVIQVVALEWKWLFIYPKQGIATVNFIQIPEKTPIDFEITADAPMNSFWIPQLGGQIYAMPAMRTKLHLIANETGLFRGSSSNISGKGFAGMNFSVRASSEEEFLDWVSLAQTKGNKLNAKQYQILSQPSEYVPPQLFQLEDGDLFEQILHKYMKPLS